MSSTEEVQKPTAAPKEKKPKATKTASHPPYFEMIKDALLALKEKGGSSPHAIAKYMEEKHKAVLPANFRKILGLQLKNSATKGKLIKVKASYKLSESEKKDKASAAKPAAKKTAAAAAKPGAKKIAAAAGGKKTAEADTKKLKSTKASTTAPGKKRKADALKKKVVTKKATPTKAKPPKSIKSPGAKRTRKL